MSARCPTVELATYAPEFAAAFARLNYQWIEQFFAVEAEDCKALEDPEGYAINRGGQIFLVLEDAVPVGCVAMVPYSDEVMELAKMAVRPDKQGRGYSKMLMQACIDFAHAAHAREIVLVTNDILKPALALYERAGFVAQEQLADARYARGNLEMRLKL